MTARVSERYVLNEPKGLPGRPGAIGRDLVASRLGGRAGRAGRACAQLSTSSARAMWEPIRWGHSAKIALLEAGFEAAGALRSRTLGRFVGGDGMENAIGSVVRKFGNGSGVPLARQPRWAPSKCNTKDK